MSLNVYQTKPTCLSHTQVPLKVWLFGCPGSLMSPEVASITSQWTTSVVLGKDLVSRLTLPCIERLRDDVILARCVSWTPLRLPA